MSKILLGPILGYEDGNVYTCVIVTPASAAAPSWQIDGQTLTFSKADTTPSGAVWRAEANLDETIPTGATGKDISYRIKAGNSFLKNANNRTSWTFHLPGATGRPRLAYASCNGFSEPKNGSQNSALALWERMLAEHKKEPFSLLLMGGDQLYNDNVFEAVEWLSDWNTWFGLSRNYNPKPAEKKAVDAFYGKNYQRCWVAVRDQTHDAMINAMATIPSVMMWDDHDIIDGYGSHRSELHKTPVYKTIFAAAKRYFELIQIRTRSNRNLLRPNGRHYSLGFTFRNYRILALDNRSKRTPNQIMDASNWKDVIDWLDAIPEEDSKSDLLVMSAVPVVYRLFEGMDRLFRITPGDQALEDDIIDHWSNINHQSERSRLVFHLFDTLKKKSLRKAFILSGDVHVGSLGQLRQTTTGLKIVQITSSGIVHPPPTSFQWRAILAATSDQNVPIPGADAMAELMKPVRHPSPYIVSRNFASIQEGTDEKIWANWIAESTPEGEEYPHFPI